MKKYRIIFECCDEDFRNTISRTVVTEGDIKKPEDLFGLGFSHQEQISLVRSLQDNLLQQQSELIGKEDYCPHCSDTKMVKNGKRVSDYHDVLTDHKITLARYRCKKCNYESGSTILKLIGTALSGDLTRIQTELGSNYSYRESQEPLAKLQLC